MFLLLNQPIQYQSDLVDIARKGVSKSAVMKMAKTLELSGKELTFIINLSERTLQRYENSHKLDKVATEKAMQLAQLYERGKEVWGDLEKFKRWMRYKSPVLGYKMPIELLDTSFGFQMVLDEIGRIEHGVLA